VGNGGRQPCGREERLESGGKIHFPPRLEESPEVSAHYTSSSGRHEFGINGAPHPTHADEDIHTQRILPRCGFVDSERSLRLRSLSTPAADGESISRKGATPCFTSDVQSSLDPELRFPSRFLPRSSSLHPQSKRLPSSPNSSASPPTGSRGMTSAAVSPDPPSVRTRRSSRSTRKPPLSFRATP